DGDIRTGESVLAGVGWLRLDGSWTGAVAYAAGEFRALAPEPGEVRPVRRPLSFFLQAVILVTIVSCGGEGPPLTVVAPTNVAASADYGVITVTWDYVGIEPEEFEVWSMAGGSSGLLGIVP